MTSDMVKPSDQWTSFQNLDNESKHAKQIEELLSNADFGYLCSHALAIRREGRSSGVKENQPDGYTCSVDPSKFAYGSYNVAFEVAFSDSVCWIARVRLPYEAEEDAQVEKDMLSEIATMRLVKQKTTVPVPEVFGYDVNGTNALGYRYILMEALPGRVLDSTFSRAIPETHKEKVAGQFAEYFHQLSKLRFDKIGRVWTGTKIDEQPHIISFNMTDGVDGGYTRRTVGPFATSLEYFYTVRQGDNRAVLSKHADEDDWAMACWVLKQALPVMITEDNIH
ncbi:MAG: hypothetical protein M1830_005670, partial [Pleopsidium flavum]